MTLQFERGDTSSPVGHALIYFRSDAGSIHATYVSVPPIAFDLGKYVPQFMQGAMQGMDLADAMVAAPMPPIPEEVESHDFLMALAAHRHDDLIFAGTAVGADPMRLAAETAEAARQYGELYAQAARNLRPAERTPQAPPPAETSRFAAMTQQEQLGELTSLTGRMRESLNGGPDPEIEGQMEELAALLPPKYRVRELIAAARIPGDRGKRLAELHIERVYKLYNEEYLDLERIDREIESIQG